ncbi:MAG TPA: hypothetical protein VH880_14595 [Anaeromyxobacteraceae bacterium]|jgi:hypothetical protein
MTGRLLQIGAAASTVLTLAAVGVVGARVLRPAPSRPLVRAEVERRAPPPTQASALALEARRGEPIVPPPAPPAPPATSAPRQAQPAGAAAPRSWPAYDEGPPPPGPAPVVAARPWRPVRPVGVRPALPPAAVVPAE